MPKQYKLAKRSGSPFWYITWSENRRSRRHSTGTDDRKQAELIFSSFLLEINSLSSKTEPDKILVSTILNNYFEDYAFKLPSKETTKFAIAQLNRFYGLSTIDKITFVTVQSFIDHRASLGRRNSTIARELSVLNAALRYAVKVGRLDKAPLIQLPPSSPARQRYLTRPEAARLLWACHSLHLRMFMRIALYTGARTGAILDLTWDRVDLKNCLKSANDSLEARLNGKGE